MFYAVHNILFKKKNWNPSYRWDSLSPASVKKKMLKYVMSCVHLNGNMYCVAKLLLEHFP